MDIPFGRHAQPYRDRSAPGAVPVWCQSAPSFCGRHILCHLRGASNPNKARQTSSDLSISINSIGL